MSLAACLLALAVVRAPLAVAATEEALARVSTIQLSPGSHVREAVSRDVDLDGVADLVLVASIPGASAAAAPVRRLAIHLRRASGPAFVAAADASLDLTADVVAFAIADVGDEPGCEIVLLNASGAFAWSPLVREARVEKLVACEFLWQIADREAVFHWQHGIVDLDADGLDDLVLPAADGYRIALQRRAERTAERDARDGSARGEARERFPIVVDLRLSDQGLVAGPADSARVEVRRPGRRRAISLSFDSGSIGFEASRAERGALLRVTESVPAPHCLDWDGDGDLDVLALSPTALHVFRQEPRGVFAREQELVLASPVAVDRARSLDVSFSARALDLDLDGRADCLFFAGDKRAKDVRTQALVYLQAAAGGRPRAGAPPPALFGTDGAPTQLLVIGGFARPLRPQDVDGDGRLDLVAGSVEPDLIDELRSVSSERIDAQLYVYRNTGRGFSKRPDLVRKLSIPARNDVYAADFVGDVTGDGTSELLLREDAERLSLHPVRRSREGLAVGDEPLWELAVEPEARLLLPGRLGPGSWDLWVIEKEQVLCASFR